MPPDGAQVGPDCAQFTLGAMADHASTSHYGPDMALLVGVCHEGRSSVWSVPTGSVVTIRPLPVPEPSGTVLLLVGALVLAGLCERRTKTAARLMNRNRKGGGDEE